MKTAAIYARVSSDKQKEENTIASQTAALVANDTEYGLHAFVSGTDVQRARRVASQLQAGRVAINGMLDDQQAPFGGFKHSGLGREFGTYGIEAFLEPRAILE
jgi:aldehyde dehydrogenase (NAD+)